ncbi:MAG: dienelactone hydrolase family protein [Clostridia bacterium]
MRSKRTIVFMISALLCAAMLFGCASPAPASATPEATVATTEAPLLTKAPTKAESTIVEIPVTGQVYDLFDYLWNLPANASDEEFAKYAVRDFKFVQSIEPIVSEESYINLYGASVRLKQKKDGAKEGFIEALGALALKQSVADGVYFLWDAENMPLLNGEQFSEEELDKGPLDSYGFVPLLVKCLLANPTTAKGNIILCSGGGMTNRSNDGEAYPAISVFNNLGYNVFVLQRRIRPYSDEDIFMDQQRAIRIVRYYAEQEGWGGQDMIAACGWSGGAATVIGAVNNLFGDRNPTYYDSSYIPDAIDAVNSDLDVALPIYGGALDDKGENTNLPAFYTCVGSEDNVVGPEGTTLLYEVAIARGVDAAMNIFEGAGHGFGVGQEGAIKSTPECATWPGIADAFMQAHLGYSKK